MTETANNDDMAGFVEAFAKAQSEMKNAVLNKTNPHFKSKYADLSEIRDCTVPILARHGIAVTQLPILDNDGGFILVTRLLHKGTVGIEAKFPLPMNIDQPQKVGSAITYAKRYSLASICCISAEEDDDGNAASQGNGDGRKPMSMQQFKKETDWSRVEAWIAEANTTSMIIKRRDEINSRKGFWPKAAVDAALDLIDAQERTLAEKESKPITDGMDPDKAAGFNAQAPAQNNSPDPIPSDQYEKMIADWGERLKAAAPDYQAEIWESEIQVRIEDGQIFPPDADNLRALIKDAA